MYLILSLVLSTAIALIVHELGHLVAARCCGVKASEFGFGAGRRLFRIQFATIAFSWRLYPIGSFVMLDGSALRQRSISAQLFVHLSGVILNLIVGLVSFGTVFGWINLLLVAGNVLPLYQHDGWKCGMVVMQALMKRKSQSAERAFTFSGGFASVLVARAVIRLFI